MRILLSILLIVFLSVAHAQTRYFTKSGVIVFESDAPLEKITATNKRVATVLDTETGQLEFSALIRLFEFKKALMQEHFNEEYMESHKYPNAVFKGRIADFENINLNLDGTYNVKVEGELTMHGVTNTIVTDAQIVRKNGKLSASSSFSVKLVDYQIKVPSLMFKNIAEVIDIKVTIPEYELLKK